MTHAFRLVAALLLVGAFLVAPARAAEPEMMDKADAPGGKMKGPVRAAEVEDAVDPAGILTDDGKGTPATGPAIPIVPSRENCQRIVTATLLEFDRALKTRSFTGFHITELSKPFAEQFDANALLQTFQPFIASEASLTGIANVEANFDSDPVVEDRLLKLKGTFSTRPMMVRFDCDYALENGAWKLNAMTVSLKGQAAPMPQLDTSGASAAGMSDAELTKLVTGTLLDFNGCIRNGGNFAPLLAKASQSMRWQTKPAQLKEAFAAFIENGTDIGSIAGATPEFDGPAKVDGKQLTASGHYRVLPLFVIFQIDYFREANQWKLLGISVNTLTPAEQKKAAKDGPADVGGDKPADDGDAAPTPPAMKKPMKPSDGEMDPAPAMPAMPKK